MKKFVSDNNAPVHPSVVEAVARCNEDDFGSYGQDDCTEAAAFKVQAMFTGTPDVYFVTTGTAANIIGLAGLLKPWESVLCAETAHINTDECGAFERLTGNKIIPVKTQDGKLTPELLRPYLHTQGVVHLVEHRVVSISNVCETGVLYTPEEIAVLGEFCRENGLYLHLDGARIANACEKLGCSVRELTEACGVDVLSFGGTKNGLMMAEAVIVFERAKHDGYAFLQKQMMQLVSKHRYLAAQFSVYLEDDLYLKTAQQANQATARLAELLLSEGISIVNRDSYANILFLDVDADFTERLARTYPLHAEGGHLRIVTSFDTTEEDIQSFYTAVQEAKHQQ